MTIEAVITFFLVLVVFATAVDPNGAFDRIAGIAIGLTVAFGFLMAGGLTRRRHEPCACLRPRARSGHWTNAWVWCVGPLAGGALAAVLYEVLYLSRRLGRGGAAQPRRSPRTPTTPLLTHRRSPFARFRDEWSSLSRPGTRSGWRRPVRSSSPSLSSRRSSFPRFYPNFPGKKGLSWYIPLCFVFFIAMLSAVITFGKEQKVAEAAAPGSSAPAAQRIAAGKAVFIDRRLRRLPHLHAGREHGHDRPEPRRARGPTPTRPDSRSSSSRSPRSSHPPAKYVPPGFPTNVMPGNVRDVAEPRSRSPTSSRSSNTSRSPAGARMPGGAPLGFCCPGEVAEWLKAAPC